MRAIASVLLLQGVGAIVRRSDVADAKYVVVASGHPEIVAVNPGGNLRNRYRNSTSGFNVECGGTMISKKHVITAAHCFEDGASQRGFQVEVNGKKLKAVATHFNPSCKFNLKKDGPNNCDSAIVELNGEADVTPMPVYHWDDETGKHMDIYGWGVTGTADKISAKNCDDGAEDGKFRHGENNVNKVSAPSGGGGIIYYTMRKTGGLPLEAISASGDSGSPVYIQGPDGNMYIAGTNSGSDDNNGCRYGSTDQYCRLSRHYDWITSVIGGSPAPGPSPPSPSPPSPPSPPAPTPPSPPSPPPSTCCGVVKEQCGPKLSPPRVTYDQCVACGKDSSKVDAACSSKSKMKDCCDDLFPWPPSSSDIQVV